MFCRDNSGCNEVHELRDPKVKAESTDKGATVVPQERVEVRPGEKSSDSVYSLRWITDLANALALGRKGKRRVKN